MRKMLTLMLVLAMLLSICACGMDAPLTTNPINSSQSTINQTEASTDSSSESTHSPTTSVPCSHSYQDATCNTPKTCSKCGATEGHATGHNWNNATCSTPKTCSKCGATDGEAAGHNWKDATCSEPKTCTICGTSTGLTAGHYFTGGKCTTCGKADPDYNQETLVWIPTKGGTKYHTHAGCSNMDNPEQVTQSEAESRGFTPCKRCH